MPAKKSAIDNTIYYLRKLTMKKDWQKLTYEQQKVFKDKASYLLERGYIIQDKTVEELAIEIYKKNG
jgi:hypothetical protein